MAQQTLRFRGPTPLPAAVMRGPPPLLRPPPPPFAMMRGPPPPPRPPFGRPPFDPSMPPIPPPTGMPPPLAPPHLQVNMAVVPTILLSAVFSADTLHYINLADTFTLSDVQCVSAEDHHLNSSRTGRIRYSSHKVSVVCCCEH